MRGLLKELQVRKSEYSMLAEQAHFVVDSVEELVDLIPELDRGGQRSRLRGVMLSNCTSSGRKEA